MEAVTKFLLWAMVFFASIVTFTMIYLIVGGLLGFKVSSFSEEGPHRPFFIVYYGIIVTFIFFIAWAIAFGIDHHRRNLTRRQESSMRNATGPTSSYTSCT